VEASHILFLHAYFEKQGIRVYHEGAFMLPHVDRLPLVASAMIGVAQDVDEDWPLVRCGFRLVRPQQYKTFNSSPTFLYYVYSTGDL
jgi:hypothetical protein